MTDSLRSIADDRRDAREAARAVAKAPKKKAPKKKAPKKSKK